MKLVFLTLLMAFFILPHAALPRDLFVNPATGNDENSGESEIANARDGPFRTIRRAMEVVAAGDTVHLASSETPYHEGIEIRDGLLGTAEKPIIIDGQGATLYGCTPIVPSDWTSLGQGLYRNERLLPDLFPKGQPANQAVLRRFFFVFNGQMNRMGRSGKGDCPPLPDPGALRPGEWTFDETESAFYLRIDPNTELASRLIEYPDLMNGVKTSDGRTEHIIIRNLTARRFNNDGFNINGATLHTRFENVQAIECGDDGMSAHTESDIVVNGFISRGNSTGFCHVQGANSVSRNVTLEDNHGFEILLVGWGRHELTDAVIRPNSGQIRPVRISSEGAELGKRCGLTLTNVKIDADAAAQALATAGAKNPEHELSVEVLGSSDLVADRLTLLSVGIANRWSVPGHPAAVQLMNSSVGGAVPTRIELLPEAKWEANDNHYDVISLNVGGTRYEPAQWDAYRQAMGQDANSTWALPPLPRPSGELGRAGEGRSEGE